MLFPKFQEKPCYYYKPPPPTTVFLKTTLTQTNTFRKHLLIFDTPRFKLFTLSFYHPKIMAPKVNPRVQIKSESDVGRYQGFYGIELPAALLTPGQPIPRFIPTFHVQPQIPRSIPYSAFCLLIRAEGILFQDRQSLQSKGVHIHQWRKIEAISPSLCFYCWHNFLWGNLNHFVTVSLIFKLLKF